MKVEIPSVIGAKMSENRRIKVRRRRTLKFRILHHNHHHPLVISFNRLITMSTTFGSLPVVPSDDPRRTYDGFAPHPDVPVESTSILAAMEDEEFEWSQEWIDQYWKDADEVIRIRNEEVRSRKAGVKRKRTGGDEGSAKKKLKVSNNYLLFLKLLIVLVRPRRSPRR